MSLKLFKFLLWVGLLGVLTLACRMPAASAPTPFSYPTPDTTLTAIFSVLVTPPSPTAGLSFPTLPPAITATSAPIVLPTVTPLPASPTSLPPTATVAPTRTASIPTMRSGASISASYVSQAPTIDGTLGEWNATAYLVNNVVFGANKWDNNADLSGRVMATWNESYLFLGVEVTDEDYEQNATGDNLYKGDSLEILMDTNLASDFYVDSLSPDDFQLGISPGSSSVGDDPEAYLWFPANIKGARTNIQIAAHRTSTGYTVEVAIPWNVFEMTPTGGGHYGFAFSISDNDKDGENLQQSMVSNISNRRLTDPTSWGDLTLVRP